MAESFSGRVVWRELATRDLEQSKRFYGELFGWRWENFGGPDGPYPMIVNKQPIGGLFLMPKDAPFPPHWVSYVAVPDVDAAAARAQSLGAKVPHGPADIPEVGRFAVMMDPDGAVIDLFRPSPRPGETPPSGMPGAGDFCWETLSCKDPAASIRFYEQVTGWKSGPGPGGATVFMAGGAPVANVIKAPPGAPPSWMTYVAVERLTTSREKAVKLGARLVVPEAGVPDVGVLSVIADPSGAVLGLFQGERQP